MIDQELLSSLRSWFAEYVKTFRSEDPVIQQNMDMKEHHTRRVCAEIVEIGESLNLTQEDLHLAGVIALLHDVGRFVQYARYGTFLDLRSEDHAQLGIEILREKSVLKGIDHSTRELILCAIAYHNRTELPKGETERCLFFTKLLRDADKLDIWRVVTDYYSKRSETHNEVIELGLPDTPEISDEVCTELMAGRSVKVESLKTLNDFKLLQMGWVYDINFPRTFRLIRERGYLEMIRDALPRSQKTLRVYSRVQSYLEENCRNKKILQY
jgi:HD superfamily phosphohydrolase YqeK